MSHAESQGLQLHYRTFGDREKPPVLLVMGLALSSEAWLRLPELLARNHYVITFDNRGAGRSERPRKPYRMRDLAVDAAAVLSAAGVAQADVIGISMGGMIAQELALCFPERVRRLVLGCTFSSWASSKKPGVRVFKDLFSLLRARADQERAGRLLLGPGWLDEPGHREQFARWREAAMRDRARPAVLQLLAVGLHSTTRRLKRLRAPTLVVTGDADRLVRPENSHRLAERIPGARLHVFKGAGHVFPLEREEEFVRLLEEHFG